MFATIAALSGAALLAAATPAATPPAAQLPPDINPVSRSRLPMVERGALDADGQRIFDMLLGANRDLKASPAYGPAPATLHAPQMAEPYEELNRRLRKTILGRRAFEIGTLLGAQAYNQEFEWNGHEPAAIANGVEPAVLDVIRNKKPTTGLAEKDRILIDYGRALLYGDHKVPPALFAQAVDKFGDQGAIEWAAIIGDYVMAAIMLNAVDQQLAPGRENKAPWKKP